MSVNMGLQLFPPPPKKQTARKTSPRPLGVQQDPQPSSAVERARSPEIPDGRQSALSGRVSTMDGRRSAMDTIAAPVSNVGTEIPRSYTSFSDAPTLVRSHSSASHSSIAKPRFTDSSSNNGGPSTEQPMIRSIFPRYNPGVTLDRQSYYPTQAGPAHIPKTNISKAPYSPSYDSTMGNPLSAPPTVGRFPRGVLDVPKTVSPSSTEELKELWKVTNGWRVSASEGRSFCLKMTSSVDVPVHTLSSATQPFYTLRLDPTSTSALMTLNRLDPYKPTPKGASSPKPSGSSTTSKSPGTEVLLTTLEESARRLPPNDGLVALLYPKAATTMALDLAAKPNRPDEDAIIEAAERECGRLVWDDDSNAYYLVHPALATPFKIHISTLPAWSRVEYTLEHPELPQNLAKLTRDGAGGGFLEIDTGVAARIDCFYIVDVAICAVLLVALAEEKAQNIEHFAAPPPNTASGLGSIKSPARSLHMSFRKDKDKEKAVKVEEMELDLESQSSGSVAADKKKSALPAPTKGVLRLLYWAFKFVIWILTVSVNAAAAIIIGVSKCLTKA